MEKRFWICLFAVSAAASSVHAKISLPAVFGHHMVLQQRSEITVWGWGKPLAQVTLIAGWDGKEKQTVVDNHANWRVTLTTPAAGGPYALTVLGSNTVVLEDVWIGEVWLCSGQSNMEWSAAAGIDSAGAEVLRADHPEIRFFQVPQRAAATQQLDCGGRWEVCTPQSMRDFSAVAYFFGRELAGGLNVSVGLIHSSWGGTPAEAWMRPQTVAENVEFASAAARFQALPWCPVEPGSAFHAMVAPLVPFPIAGVLWYQGETNTLNPVEYERLFPAMIADWRREWGKEFPFYYVQIAPYRYDKPFIGVLVRDAQRKSLCVPNTGMVVTSDIGDTTDIHPRNKRDVGRRLANWALAKTYGKSGIAFCGPMIRGMRPEGGRIRILFDHAEHGLVCRGAELTHFQVAGNDRMFVPARAVIEGGSVVVWSERVKRPAAVRFAWSNTATPNLFNADGLPASCFRTDDWPLDGME